MQKANTAIEKLLTVESTKCTIAPLCSRIWQKLDFRFYEIVKNCELWRVTITPTLTTKRQPGS